VQRRNRIQRTDAAVDAAYGSRLAEADVTRLVLVAKALSDPIRLRMLELMVRGRGCCGLPDPASRGVPGSTALRGICVCEFQAELDLSQPRTSYHLRVLREAGLVREETRGKWTFCELEREAAEAALAELRGLLRL
jgi:ArsR family transcriptional regulator